MLVAFDFAPGRFTFEPYCAQARPRRVCSREEASERARSALLLHLADALPRLSPVAREQEVGKL